MLGPADVGYDEHRVGWNRAFRHRPAAIVVPVDGSDVVEAVRAARAGGLRLVVQATGHGVGVLADERSLLLDLRRLVGLSLDARARTVTVAGGTTWAPVLAATAPLGLAPVLPEAVDVGIVGSTLGGGVGWLARRHGLSRDRVLAAHVVTAEGAEVVASAEGDRELWWGVRGGGVAGLGVVTSMTLELVAPSELHAGELCYPVEMAAEVLARYSSWTEALPAAMTSTLAIEPGGPTGADDRAHPVVVLRGCYAGPADEAADLVASWCTWAAPVEQRWGPIGIADLADRSRAAFAPRSSAVTTEWLRGLPDAAIAAICSIALPSNGAPTLGRVELRHLAGAFDEGHGGPGAGPVPGVPGDLLLRAEGPVHHRGPTDPLAALRRALGESAVTTGGTYLNFTSGAERRERAATAFAPSSAERLAALAGGLDPAGLLDHPLEPRGEG
ncbi:FAD-binding oxidoreductase [Aquihabitans daechungensis]|uniref:FAD-binding oxidoreductase n=1 Tax=Aquihabitans daechungensis TaxID=1052257 RepID=UPI003BA1C050